MKIKTSLSILFALICLQGVSTAQWTQLPVVPGFTFMQMSFPTATTGYAMGSPGNNGMRILKTTDGAMTWDTLTLPFPINTQLQTLHFPTTDTGYFSARSVFGFGMRVMKTVNGGTTWNDASADTSNLGYGNSFLHFVSGTKGFFAVGSILYKTTNAGTTWAADSLGMYAVNAIDFADMNHGLAGNWDGTFNYSGGVYRTTDCGVTWNTTLFPWGNTKVDVVSYPETGVAYLASDWGGDNKFRRSFDGGVTWDSIGIISTPFQSIESMEGMRFSPGGKGFFSMGNGRLLMSADSGNTWVQERAPDSIPLRNFQIAGGKVYLAGGYGVILKRDLSLGIETELHKKGITLFPNPARAGGKISFEISEGIHIDDIVIMDGTGKSISISEWSVRENRVSCALPNISQGIYFVRMITENRIVSGKILVD